MRPDGRLLVTGRSDGTINLWDTATAKALGQAAQEHRHQGTINCLAFRSDGLQFASAAADGFVRLWSINQE